MFAIDTETHLIRCGEQLPRVVCMTIASPSMPEPVLLVGDAIPNALATMLASGEDVHGHNVAFDMGAVACTWPELEPYIAQAYEREQIKCTMTRAQLHDYAGGRNARRYGLDRVCDRLGGHVPNKNDPWRLRYSELDGVSLDQWPQEAKDYAIGDAIAALGIVDAIPEPVGLGLMSRYDSWLKMSSAIGVATDAPAVAEWAKSLYIKEAVYRRTMIAHGLIRDDGTRDLAAIRARIDATGKARYTDHPTKPSIKTDGISCAKCGDPVMRDYALYTAVQASITRELPILQAPFVHTFYGLAETCRTTSSHPNLQNLTNASGSRLCFMPRAGMVYLIADFDRLELCAIAQLCLILGCGDKLANALRSGRNPHRMLTSRLTGTPEADLNTVGEHKRPYRLSKEANFGFSGGMGIDTFIETAEKRGLDLTRGQAESLRRAWRNQWPEIPRYQAKCAQYSEANGQIEHYPHGIVRGGLNYTQSCNSPFQHLGGLVAKECGWRLYRAGLIPSLFIHDEYLIEVPRESYRDAAATVERIAREAARELLPDIGCNASPTAAVRWTKAAPVHDAHGGLAVIE